MDLIYAAANSAAREFHRNDWRIKDIKRSLYRIEVTKSVSLRKFYVEEFARSVDELLFDAA